MRKTTAEKIQAEQARKQQIENGIKKLQQQQRAEERKARTKRLIERGAIVESLIENPADLTNEQFFNLVKTALDLYGKGKPAKLGKTAPAEPEETAGSEDEAF
jgi:uncharacterized protein YaiL (DUF2058 family)